MPIPDLPSLEKDFLSQGKTVLEKLDHWVAFKGDSPCLYYGEAGQIFTYQEFDRLTNQLANGFAKTGVGKGDRISILSKNNLVTTLAMFASWKLGAVYCPINNSYKGDLLAYILNDTGPKVLFLDQQFVADVNAVAERLEKLPLLVVHEPEEGDHDYNAAVTAQPDKSFGALTLNALLDAPDTTPDVPVFETDLANIIYTSGTTGNPKGVVQNHKWMHGYIYGLLRRCHQDEVIYSDLPLYHVGGACFNVVRAVWSGCKLALWDRFSPKDFWRRIHTSGATFAMLMDVMIDWLMQVPPSEEDRNNTLKHVGMMPLPANHHAVARRFGFDFVGIGYGSTELGAGFGGLIDEWPGEQGTPTMLWKGFSKEVIRQHHRELVSDNSLVPGNSTIRKGFMGVPSPLVDVKVVDEEGNPVGPRVPGQAVFRHRLPDMLFREYFNKPEATAEAVRDGWYYPSDLISYDEDGLYYFEDRKQGFIRVRGENLSAVTVEHQLQQHPAIHRSAVIGVPAAEGNEQDIAAFIVLKNGGDLPESCLHEWAEGALPKFMRPRYFRFVEELPVTPTFKVEKYKLKSQMLKELKLSEGR